MASIVLSYGRSLTMWPCTHSKSEVTPGTSWASTSMVLLYSEGEFDFPPFSHCILCEEDKELLVCLAEEEGSIPGVGHDHWDSDSTDILGGNVWISDPIAANMKCFPSFLDEVEDKKSVSTAETTLELLALCGIEKEDI